MSSSRNVLFAIAVTMAASSVVRSEDKSTVPPKLTDNANPEWVEKQPDYHVQGEYLGTEDDNKAKPIGANVIARDKGKFDVILFQGGLPGKGYDAKGGQHLGPFSVARKGDVVEGTTKDGRRIVLQDGKLTGYSKAGTKNLVLERIMRKSSTLGEKPPEGAIVLFDGSNADGWQKTRLRGFKQPIPPITAEGFLLRGTTSKKKLGSCKIHLEFRTPWEPNRAPGGQGRGNSGVYVQGSYEIQVLDSFGTTKLGPGHCGSIYSVAVAPFNMCFPPMQWQTYDIDFTAAEFDTSGAKPKRTKDATISVWQNGVLLHKDVKIKKSHTTAAPKREGPEPRGLFLQDHGHWVVYRNIWVVEK